MTDKSGSITDYSTSIIDYSRSVFDDSIMMLQLGVSIMIYIFLFL